MTDANAERMTQLGLAFIAGIPAMLAVFAGVWIQGRKTAIEAKATRVETAKKTDEQTAMLVEETRATVAEVGKVHVLVNQQHDQQQAIIDQQKIIIISLNEKVAEQKTAAVEVEHKAEMEHARADERARLDPDGPRTG